MPAINFRKHRFLTADLPASGSVFNEKQAECPFWNSNDSVFMPPILTQLMMDEGRFLTLFLRHERELAAIARAFLADWDAVDDVLQEASLVMWRKISQLESDDEFLTWAKVILRFGILKARRLHARRRWVLDEELMSRIMDESGDQEDSVRHDRQLAIQECLRSFSREHQKLLLAPHTSRGGVLALAEASGSTSNSLYKRIARLRVKLHDCVVQRLSSTDFDPQV